VKFLTQKVAHEYFARATAATVQEELSAAIKLGRGNGNVFKSLAAYELSRNGINGEIRVLPCGKAKRVLTIRLGQCGVRYFANAEHLARLVATDAKNHDRRMYIPMARNHPLVDAWCICTVGGKWTVVGLQMTVAKLLHPIAGEDVAREQFSAIHDSLAQHQFAVQMAAWLVFVVPAAHYSMFPYEHATRANRRKAGLVSNWPHTQAKLAVQLDEAGKPPANVGDMRNSRKTAVNRPRHGQPSSGSGSGSGSWQCSTSLSKARGCGLVDRVLDSDGCGKRRRLTDGAPAPAAPRGVENSRRAAAERTAGGHTRASPPVSALGERARI